MDRHLVFEDTYFKVEACARPCNAREDGGHLILRPREPVFDRSEFTAEQAIDYVRITMMVGKAMYDVLGIERMNYEDNGNWGLDDADGPKMHLHFIGRNREQRYQVRGQHFNLMWPKEHPIYRDGTLEPLTDDEVKSLRKRVLELVHEEKYQILARMAGLPVVREKESK